MTIILNYPMVCARITWPIVGVGILAPVPNSLSGKVGNDYGWTYSVYLENTSREEYEAYVQKCIDAGFSKDVSNYGDSIWADYLKDDDISINVSYEGFNIMYVHVAGSLNEDCGIVKMCIPILTRNVFGNIYRICKIIGLHE